MKHLTLTLAVSLALLGTQAHAVPLGSGKGISVLPNTVAHGVASEEDDDSYKEMPAATPAYDPLEGLNRHIYGFNKGLDTAILKPAATVYKAVVPSLARQGVNNFLAYLHTPLDVVNYALQGNKTMAGDAMGRLLLNTFGLGVFDIASEAGIPRKQTGFGETFGVWGMPQGPYVVLPFFGGRSLRSTVGTLGDSQLGVVGNLKTDERTTALVFDALDTRASLLGADSLISGISLDEYLFVRDALLQREKNRVEDLKE